MNNSLIDLYVATINVASGLVFTFDKQAAIKGRRRIPERTLHLLEIMGGVFTNLLLMYSLRHKHKKFSYWMWTWVIGIGWVMVTLNLSLR